MGTLAISGSPAIKFKKQMKSQAATFHSSKNLKQRLKRQHYMSDSDDGSSSEVDASRPKVANRMPTISLLSESEE